MIHSRLARMGAGFGAIRPLALQLCLLFLFLLLLSSSILCLVAGGRKWEGRGSPRKLHSQITAMDTGAMRSLLTARLNLLKGGRGALAAGPADGGGLLPESRLSKGKPRRSIQSSWSSWRVSTPKVQLFLIEIVRDVVLGGPARLATIAAVVRLDGTG